MQRRTFLTGTAAALTPAIAGCGGGGNGDDSGNGNGAPSTTEDDGTTTGDDGMTTNDETAITDDDGMTTTEADETTTTDDSGTPTGERPSELTVELTSSNFEPLQAQVAVGGTVEWVNEDGFNHDVTSAQYSDSAADWDYSESLGGGESVSRTFDSAGVYEYYCTIHGEGNMCGVVVVGDVSYDGSLPCSDGGGSVDY